MIDDQAGVATAAAQRQSDRIRYAYRLRITGKDAAGKPFDENARTEIITRDGGLIITTASIEAGTVLSVGRASKTVDARVIGQVGLRNEECLYGIQFLRTPESPFWEVHFASAPVATPAGKLVLQCSRCSRQEVVYLSEVELMVYESTQVISHPCDKCGVETLWNKPDILGEGAIVSGSAAYAINAKSQPKRSRDTNDRRHSRVSMRNIKACLHRHGCDDDIVQVSNLSRGGIGFASMIDYAPGMLVEVAVPYTEGGSNVFTPATVVRVRCRPTADLPGEFGLAYVKK